MDRIHSLGRDNKLFKPHDKKEVNQCLRLKNLKII